MTKIISASIVALAVLAGASSAMADTQRIRDFSDQYGGYDHNSPEGIRAFWEEQSR